MQWTPFSSFELLKTLAKFEIVSEEQKCGTTIPISVVTWISKIQCCEYFNSVSDSVTLHCAQYSVVSTSAQFQTVSLCTVHNTVLWVLQLSFRQCHSALCTIQCCEYFSSVSDSVTLHCAQYSVVSTSTQFQTVSLCTVHNTRTKRTGLICGHTTKQFYNEVL